MLPVEDPLLLAEDPADALDEPAAEEGSAEALAEREADALDPAESPLLSAEPLEEGAHAIAKHAMARHAATSTPTTSFFHCAFAMYTPSKQYLDYTCKLLCHLVTVSQHYPYDQRQALPRRLAEDAPDCSPPRIRPWSIR